jgi:hypothetical protein
MELNMTDQQKKILEAVPAFFVNRSEIARVIGKTELSPYDRTLLDLLVDKGLLEREERPSGITKKFVYRKVETNG